MLSNSLPRTNGRAPGTMSQIWEGGKMKGREGGREGVRIKGSSMRGRLHIVSPNRWDHHGLTLLHARGL